MYLISECVIKMCHRIVYIMTIFLIFIYLLIHPNIFTDFSKYKMILIVSICFCNFQESSGMESNGASNKMGCKSDMAIILKYYLSTACALHLSYYSLVSRRTLASTVSHYSVKTEVLVKYCYKRRCSLWWYYWKLLKINLKSM